MKFQMVKLRNRICSELHYTRIGVALCLFLTLSSGAFAVDSGTSSSPIIRYEKALNQINQSGLLNRKMITRNVFSEFDWVGKTALINVTCQGTKGKQELCQSALAQGLVDSALVVRDHSLRTVLASSLLTPAEKEMVAQKMVDDERNYRKGKAFWIVQNAQSYLNLSRRN